MFDCSGMTCEELAETLRDARKAYNQLMTGGAVRVVVDQNGERVEFTAASAMNLNTYMQQILSQMRTQGCVCAAPGSQPQKAFKFIF